MSMDDRAADGQTIKAVLKQVKSLAVLIQELVVDLLENDGLCDTDTSSTTTMESTSGIYH